jgi:hypothetical protein
MELPDQSGLRDQRVMQEMMALQEQPDPQEIQELME